MSTDTLPPYLQTAMANLGDFTPEAIEYLAENPHVYAAFEREALRVAHRGYRHYSARTIMEVLRHESSLVEVSLPEMAATWKINNNQVPYLARLFRLRHPLYADLFEFRVAKATRRHVTPLLMAA